MNKEERVGCKLQLESFANYQFEDYEATYLNLRGKLGTEVELLFSVGNSLNGDDALFIGKKKGKLFYRYTQNHYDWAWSIRYCTPETLRAFVEAKISKENNIVYWWRDEILKFIDELEKNESVQTT